MHHCGVFYLNANVRNNEGMVEIKATQAIPETHLPKIFLGGSIEMGRAEEWQKPLVESLAGYEVMLLNPRRTDWDSSWRQTKDNPQFRAQVEWELGALAQSDHIVMYLDPSTKSPISLLEIGLHARSGKLLVVCPSGFWRKGNVDIVCEKYGIQQFTTLALLEAYLTQLLKKVDIATSALDEVSVV